MNFIHSLLTVLKRSIQPMVSIDLWLDLLESEYSDQEIESFFGHSMATRHLKSYLPLPVRQQIGFLENRMNPKVALWWALREHQEQRSLRSLLISTLGYPLFLLLMAFITILFLNHILLVQLGEFSPFGSTSSSSSFWFALLKGTESIYLLALLALIGGVFMPKAIRFDWILKRYAHPLLSGYRTMNNYYLITRFSKGIKQGMPLEDVLYAMLNTQNSIISSLMKRVHENLQLGKSLGEAMQCIDPTLHAVFRLNDVERTVESNLERYLKLLNLKFTHQLQRTKWSLMTVAYISFGIIILAAYQMMFEPIRLMEELL